MNGLTLKHLRYFAALAQYRHFANAADASGISQPALSLQIKQLEELTGTSLVERGGRNVQLTALGEDLAQRAEAILRSVDDIGDVVRAAQSELAGPFRLGVIPTIAPYLLPPVVQAVSAKYPKIDLNLRETITDRLVEETARGEIDAALVALPISHTAFTQVELFSESFVLVRHPSEKAVPVPDVETLQHMRLLLLEEGHCFREQALEFCNVGTKPARNIMDGSSLTTLVQMVASGLGLTLIPEMAARIEAQSADVSLSSFPDPQPQRRIGMLWRKNNPLEAHLYDVADIVRDVGTKLSQRSFA
ncbi:MAG: hydrogen peroxide-inducible genes activator [Rhodobacteraceae bacterium]|nr:hydrogen peroxide-inducible genes activator [Paracoccaceae bacterium]